MSRLELVTECKHGKTERHSWTRGDGAYTSCAGRTRTPLDPDREFILSGKGIRTVTVQDVLDALEET